MLKDRFEFTPAHRLINILGIHQPADRDTKYGLGKIHHHQSQQEVWCGQTEKAEKCQAVVTPGILVGCGINSDWKGNNPGQNDGCEKKP